jgi:hypothetical protein
MRCDTATHRARFFPDLGAGSALHRRAVTGRDVGRQTRADLPASQPRARECLFAKLNRLTGDLMGYPAKAADGTVCSMTL